MNAFLLLCLLFAPEAPARWIPFEAFRFQPVDEAERRPDFEAYRTKLIRVLNARDVPALKALTAENVATSLVGKSPKGWDAFAREWKLEGKEPRQSALWDRLRDTLRLGGSFEGTEFLAPYVFSRWPARFPHLDFYAVTVKKAPVRRKPAENAQVLETLTQEIVGRFDDLPNPPGWRAVRTASGNTGYMSAEDTRSPLDYRAVFRKIQGEWKLALFASGDWEAHERLE